MPWPDVSISLEFAYIFLILKDYDISPIDSEN